MVKRILTVLLVAREYSWVMACMKVDERNTSAMALVLMANVEPRGLTASSTRALPVASPTGWISFAGAPREASTHLRSSALGGMAQSVHSVALPKLNFPAGQKLQSSVLSPALYFPASHAVHWPALALAWQ